MRRFLSGFAVVLPVMGAENQLSVVFSWKWFLALGLVVFAATFCAMVLARLLFRKRSVQSSDNSQATHSVAVQPAPKEQPQAVVSAEQPKPEPRPPQQPLYRAPPPDQKAVVQPIPEAESIEAEDIEIGTLILRSYTESAAKERLLRDNPTRISVSNYEQVSNRVYDVPRFDEDPRGFYGLLATGEFFPHPDEFNGYYTPHLLQGTLLLDSCFAFNGDKRQSGIVVGMRPAIIQKIGDGQYELQSQGTIDLQGEKEFYG